MNPKSRCTVLWVSAVSHIFGAERSLLAVLKFLPRESIRSVLVCPEERGGLGDEARRLGIEVIHAPLERFRASLAPHSALRSLNVLRRGVASIRRIIRSVQPDIVCSNGSHAALPGALAARWSRVPHVWHVRDWRLPGAIASLLGRLSARIVVPTQAMAARSPFNRYQSKRLTVIPNALDPEELTPAPRKLLHREFKLAQSALAVGMVAQLVPWKNHALFIRAAARLTDSFPSAYFFIIGSDHWNAHPGYAEELRSLASELKVSDRIIFTGYRPDVGVVMNSLDVLVLPSSDEPFGRVLIEAMAVELPVVASASAGPREIVSDGEDGLLFPPGDAAALAACMARLLGSGDLRREIGQCGRKKVIEHFNARTMTTRYEQLIYSVVQEKYGSGKRR